LQDFNGSNFKRVFIKEKTLKELIGVFQDILAGFN
jgi:hypothetical protein